MDFDDEIIIEDDINYNILTNDVLQNFPFIEDDVNALTDYELFSKGFEYLDDKKADKKDLPNLDNYYTKNETNDLLEDKADVSDIPDVSNFITKDVNNLTYYTKSSDLASVATSGDYGDLLNKPTIPTVPTDVSAFNNDAGYITKSVDDLDNYTKSSSLASVATSGDYGDLLNKPTIPTVPTDVSAFNNDAGYITKSVDDLTNYTDSNTLTTLLSGKENSIDIGSNSNGLYIKFSDGTLIMWGTAINNTLTTGIAKITFPITLTSNVASTRMYVNERFTSGATLYINYFLTPQINNTTTGYVYCKDNTDTYISINIQIDWLVIGKWK